MNESGTTQVGAHLVLCCPLNHHVGTLTLTSLDAPDELVFGDQPWTAYIADGQHFVVECTVCGGGTEVYDEAEILKRELSAELSNYPGGSRVTHNLAFWNRS